MKQSSSPKLLLVALALCAVLALAGCNALSDARETRTALDVNESRYTASEPVRNGSIVAFDATRDHAPEPAVLVDAHRRALTERSYTVDVRTHVQNGSEMRFLIETTSTIAADHSRYNTVTHANYSDVGTSTVRTYANGTHVWEHRVGPDTDEVELRTSAGEPVSPAAVNVTGTSRVLDGLYQTNVTDVVRVEDPPANADGDVYRVYANETARGVTSVETVSLTLTVTEAGRILTYDYRYVARNTSRQYVTAHVRVEFRAVDETTVDPPEWVPANATDANTAGPSAITTHANAIGSLSNASSFGPQVTDGVRAAGKS